MWWQRATLGRTGKERTSGKVLWYEGADSVGVVFGVSSTSPRCLVQGRQNEGRQRLPP